jgi:anthranilate phosphoribosyltransferase
LSALCKNAFASTPIYDWIKLIPVLKSLSSSLHAQSDLDPEQVECAVHELTREDLAPSEKAEFLEALAAKGETVAEIAAFAQSLRALSVRPVLDPQLQAGEILDVCGTGGDKLNTFNISTTVAIVVASANIPVAKHGNRAITSQAGSADVLEALGIPVNLTPENAARTLKEKHFAFFFAPNYHPAFKHIGPARKLCAERGRRTIFNYLGPLLNPVRPSAQLMGVPQPPLCEIMAQVLQRLGTRRAMVVSGKVQEGYLDEFSTVGETQIAEFYQDRGFHTSLMHPSDFGVQPASLSDLKGGDKLVNAEIIRAIFAGKERGPKRDAVVLNSAAALFVANKAKNIAEGMELAAHLIDSGLAIRKLKELAEEVPSA